MTILARRQSTSRILPSFSLALLAILLMASCGAAQQRSLDQQENSNPDSGQGTHSETSLVHQLHELQERVEELEAILMQNDLAASSSGMGGMGMGGMDSMSGMDGRSSTQSGQSMSGMGGTSTMGMGMGMMGRNPSSGAASMRGMSTMSMPSALPGFPGASHIYHVGETGLFLDHPQHITLTTEQQAMLNQIKERTLLANSTFDRQIDEAEQQLWVLTSSDTPEEAEIDAKIREIEKLRGDQRIAFIRAVGDAAEILNDEQRHALVGTMPPDHATPSAIHEE